VRNIACIHGPQNPVFPCECAKHGSVSGRDCAICQDFVSPSPALKVPKTKEPKSDKPNRNYMDVRQCKHPEGVCVDRYGRDCNVADLYRGASAFLVLSGPSVKDANLNLLGKRGVLIMSCNNSAAVLPLPIRPHVWLHTDPARKFCDGLWKDPSVLKFTPVREWGPGRKGEKCVCERDDSGKLVSTNVPAREYPGVIGFHRNTEFQVAQYCTENTVNRGNDKDHSFGNEKKGIVANNQPHVINTMFAALRLGLYLGFKRLYLLGVDFKMDPDQPYAFDQVKTASGVKNNNDHFADMDQMFRKLVPEFAKSEYEVVNCTEGSLLQAFPKMSLEDAVDQATEGIEQTLNTEGWYRGKNE